MNHVCEYEIVLRDASNLTLSEQNQIYELLVLCDREFIPPLSDRYTTQQQSLRPIVHHEPCEPELYFGALMKQSFLLAKSKQSERIIGFLSYVLNDFVQVGKNNNILADYVSTVIVHPSYRSHGIAKALYKYLFLVPQINAVVVRTWSTNDCHTHLLESLGFGLISTILNDRCQGVHTLYYYRVVNAHSLACLK